MQIALEASATLTNQISYTTFWRRKSGMICCTLHAPHSRASRSHRQMCDTESCNWTRSPSVCVCVLFACETVVQISSEHLYALLGLHVHTYLCKNSSKYHLELIAAAAIALRFAPRQVASGVCDDFMQIFTLAMPSSLLTVINTHTYTPILRMCALTLAYYGQMNNMLFVHVCVCVCAQTSRRNAFVCSHKTQDAQHRASPHHETTTSYARVRFFSLV